MPSLGRSLSSPSRLQRPPDYFSRGLQWRILVGLFLMVFGIQAVVCLFDPVRRKQLEGAMASMVNLSQDDAERSKNDDASTEASLNLDGSEENPSDDLADDAPTAADRAWRAGWEQLWNSLDSNDRVALARTLEAAVAGRAIEESERPKMTTAIDAASAAWGEYRARAAASVDRLTPTKRAAWSAVLEQLDYRWGQRFEPFIRSVASGEIVAADDREQLVDGLARMDAAAYGAVEDNSLGRVAEREAWLRSFRLAKTVTPENARAVGYVALFDKPELYRGKAVTVQGTAQAIYQERAGANDDGVTHYWVYVLWPTGGPNSPLLVYALEKPQGMPSIRKEDLGKQKMASTEEVKFTGVFFKRLAYASARGLDTAPLVVAVRPEWIPSATPQRKPIPWTLLGLIAIALSVAAIALATAIYRIYPPGGVRKERPQKLDLPAIAALIGITLCGWTSIADAREEPPAEVQAPEAIETPNPETPNAETPDSATARDESPRLELPAPPPPAKETAGIEGAPNEDPTAGPLPWEGKSKGPSIERGDGSPTLKEFFALIGFDAGHWRNFLPDLPLSSIDAATFPRMMHAIDRTQHDDLARWVRSAPKWSELTAELENDPVARQGQTMPVVGVVSRITRVDLVPELVQRYLFDRYHQVDLVDDAGRKLTIFSLKAPKELFDGKSQTTAPNERMGCEGIFVKRVLDEKGGATYVLAAKRMAWLPAADSRRVKGKPWLAALARGGFDIGLLPMIASENGRGLDDRRGLEDPNAELDQLQPLLTMLAAANRTPRDHAAFREPKALDIPEALSNSAALAGRAVTLTAIARRVTEIGDWSPAAQMRLGAERYYEIDAFVPLKDVRIKLKNSAGDDQPLKFSGEYPVTILTTNLPPGLVVKDQTHAVLSVQGFYYRLWGYETEFAAAANRRQLSPLIVASTIDRIASPKPTTSPVALTMIALMALIGGAAFWWLRASNAADAAAIAARRARRREETGGFRPELLGASPQPADTQMETPDDNPSAQRTRD